jgi:hypothetical protein
MNPTHRFTLAKKRKLPQGSNERCPKSSFFSDLNARDCKHVGCTLGETWWGRFQRCTVLFLCVEEAITVLLGNRMELIEEGEE